MTKPRDSRTRDHRFATDARRWQAVEARNPDADGHFYYAVATTGIYCRPTCPSRRPHRDHVTFHVTAASAEAAGYRPCRRCHPGARSPAALRAEAMAAICRRIDGAEDAPRLGDLAAAAGMSQSHFHRTFKSVVGVTPKDYAMARRQSRVREGLRDGLSVTTAIHDAGYGSSGRFYASSTRLLGMTPTQWKSGGAAMSMRFAVADCTLGVVLVAATDKGIAAILIGDDADALLRDLQDRFPKADMIGADPAFERLVAKVIGLIERPGARVELPLDVRGTAFQHLVWRALADIPAGTTLSYAEIARRIGRPEASRAVAGACAANPLAVAIPCHRVVRTDGALSGYRWGIERKRALLTRERKG